MGHLCCLILQSLRGRVWQKSLWPAHVFLFSSVVAVPGAMFLLSSVVCRLFFLFGHFFGGGEGGGGSLYFHSKISVIVVCFWVTSVFFIFCSQKPLVSVHCIRKTFIFLIFHEENKP